MLRDHHGSSFESAEGDIQFCVPFLSWRQIIRHRAASILDDAAIWDAPSVNELRGRYFEIPDLIQATASTEWRRQSSNRQGSADLVTAWSNGLGVLRDRFDDKDKDRFYEEEGGKATGRWNSTGCSG